VGWKINYDCSIGLLFLMQKSNLNSLDVPRAARGTFFIFILTFIGLGLNYIYSIFIARWLGAELFGLYSLGFSIFNLLATLSLMGLDNATLSFIPGVIAMGNTSLMKIITKRILRVGCITGGCAAIFLAFFSRYISVELYNTRELEPVFLMFAFAIPSYVLSSILISILQALHDVRWRMFVKYVSEPLIIFILTSI